MAFLSNDKDLNLWTKAMTVAPMTGKLAELSLAKILIWLSPKFSTRLTLENDSIRIEL